MSSIAMNALTFGFVFAGALLGVFVGTRRSNTKF